MIVRRSSAAGLSLWLLLSAFALVPTASATDGGAAAGGRVSRQTAPVKDTDKCSSGSKVRISVGSQDSGVLRARGTVWSKGTHKWSWRFLHNDDVSAQGEAKAHKGQGQSFQVTRSMVNLIGPDHFVFRAEDNASGEVCRVDVFF